MSRPPPRSAEALLRNLLPPGDIGLSILGDLREEFAEFSARGPRAPRLWYWRQALSLAARYRWRRSGEHRRRRRFMEVLMHDLWSDLRQGGRMLSKTPAIAAVIILTLGLAIGANTIVFSFANILLIRPLPFQEPERLVWLYSVDPQTGNDRALVSIPDLVDFRAQTTTLVALSAMADASYTLTGHGEPVRWQASQVTSDFFRATGLKPVLGRLFETGEDVPGAVPVVVLSHRLWAERFASDRTVLGTPLVLNGTAHTVVGVLTPEIEIGTIALTDIWTPLPLDAASPRDRRTLDVLGKLRPGETVERAAAELRTLGERLAETHPSTNAGWAARLVSFTEAMVGRNTWLMLTLLLLVVGVVFLIASANVANVMLARAASGTREMAVRLALGAGRLRLARQWVVESLVLALAGGAVGVSLAYAGLRAIAAVDAEPIFKQLAIDGNVLAFATLLSVLAPVLSSLAPALQAIRPELQTALHEGGRGGGIGLRARRRQSWLLVGQLALAVSLLIVSGLVARTVMEIQRIEIGFRVDDLLRLRLELDPLKYDQPAERQAFLDTLLPRLEAVPGVQHAAAAERLPLLDGARELRVAISGRPAPLPAEAPRAVVFRVSPDFFSAMDIPVEGGRVFTSEDRAGSPRVALVNRDMADRYWHGESPLGARIKRVDAASETEWIAIVGIVGNVAGGDLYSRALPQLYLPLAQDPERAMTLVLRTAGASEDVVSRARLEVSAIDPTLALYDVETVRAAIDRALGNTRIIVSMFVGFALVALLLAAAGLYGIMSYSVSQRTHEFGTRMALGARAMDILGLVLGNGARFVVLGLAIGLLAGLGLAQTMKGMLYRVTATDPSTLLGTATVLAAVAFIATYVPARRATHVNPLTALRAE